MIIKRPKFKEIKREHITDASAYMDGEYVIEPKMDGIWGAMHIKKNGTYQIWSRTGQLKEEGKVINRHFMITFTDEIDECVILGEFMYGSNWAKKHDKVGQFFAFDMVMWNGDWDFCEKPLKERREHLIDKLNHVESDETPSNLFPDFIELNQQWDAFQINGIWENLVEKQGYEGLMIKNVNDPYAEDTEWIKVKYRTDIDYVCMGFSDGGEGTKYEDTVGSIIGGLYKYSDDDRERELVDVCHVGGLTVDQRDIFNKNRDYFIGKVFTAKGFNIFDSGAIRHGKFKSFRTDKEAYDCDMSQVPSDAEVPELFT